MPPICCLKKNAISSFWKPGKGSAAGFYVQSIRGFPPIWVPPGIGPRFTPKMVHLIQALGLEGYRQFEAGMGRFQRSNGAVQTVRGYATEPLSWRLSGGMMALDHKALRKYSGKCHTVQSPGLSNRKRSCRRSGQHRRTGKRALGPAPVQEDHPRTAAPPCRCLHSLYP